MAVLGIYKERENMAKRISKYILVLLATIFLILPNALAANPDSGSILNQQMQQDVQNVPSSFPEDKIQTEPELITDNNVKVTVKKIEFSGYEGLASVSELDEIVNPYLNKELSFSQIQMIAKLLTKYLREEKGHLLSRAYLPQQDITDGVLKINIMVGKLEGQVNVVVDKSCRIDHAFLEQIAAKSLVADKPIYLRDLERAVLLINDLPGILAKAYLDKGQTPGTSKITIQAKEGHWGSAVLSGDNFGNRYTGSFRRTARVGLYDVLGKGDMFSLMYVNAAELHQGKMNFSLPVGATGTFLNLSYSGLRYELGGKLKDLRSKGYANTWTGDVKYPLKRTQKTSLWLGLGLSHYSLEDKLDGTVTSDRNVLAGNINFSGNFYDTFFGGGLTSFSVGLYPGDVDITDGKSSDDSGAGTAGKFFKTTYSLARLQRVGKNISAFFSARGQFSGCNLDSSQKILLGGPSGVRAYPVGEASGDEGHILTMEKRLELPFMQRWLRTQLVGFFDAGHVTLHKDTWTNSVTNISGRNHYWLTGIGLGVNFEKSNMYRIQCSYAHKVGKNIGRDVFDKDADNRSPDGRFWIQATIWF